MDSRERLHRHTGRPCKVRGCERRSTGPRRLCCAHAINRQRHGHELQTGVRVSEIASTKKWLRKWIRSRASGDKIWQGILDDWQLLRDKARAGLREMQMPGKAGYAWMYHALWDIVKVGGDADPEDVVLTVMAMTCLREDNPRRFVDDRSFRFQVSRRFRTLSEHNVSTWTNSHQGKPRRCYRTPSPRHANIIGDMLMEVGVHGLAIHMKWATEMAEAQARRQATASAISQSEAKAPSTQT